ncbi:putative virus X resistance protein-like, coiled-coil [Helianthus annuus]|nr:putative virus X resistance protein-like, coiled-coil [Helianthus annuus]
MADAVTSALVKLIFEKLADEAFKKYVRSQGIHSELESLGRELSQIQVVLHDASEKEIKDEAVKQWLNSLQHLAYDIDDVLDDVATEAMRHELIQKSGASTSKMIQTQTQTQSGHYRTYCNIFHVTISALICNGGMEVGFVYGKN